MAESLQRKLEKQKTPRRWRWDTVLDRLPKGLVTGVEVGVKKGDMSKELLKREDLFLWLVDIEPCLSSLVATNFAAERRKWIWKDSPDAARQFEDNSMDFVFLDADHSYHAVKTDIAAWWPKVKMGGWLCGHDYHKPRWGVGKAVNELTGVELDEDGTWFVRKLTPSLLYGNPSPDLRPPS